ncbi:MAG: hypothetical protein KGZ41_07115 [Dethiobacter sp.]|nr:hypothetical protein [Dethiobacter sp.]MBS3898126.1 hypothetical protein [Dethiobacter sp.]MBS3983556.1 hypothetical protein [Dethiobacter sp.]MCL4464265.1 hypothetical protein [Bacillota bacterium]MCL5993298.1 hypothetical protein [Bacillota bacterium]
MKKKTVFAGLLMLLFSLFVLFAGLRVTELGSQQVSGRQGTPQALRLYRDSVDGWVLVFAGQEWQLPTWLR